jgi:hypothetical protein
MSLYKNLAYINKNGHLISCLYKQKIRVLSLHALKQNILQSKMNMIYLIYISKRNNVNLFLAWVRQPWKMQHIKHQPME